MNLVALLLIADLEDAEEGEIPENVILFSQYPQYACCTTGSSLKHVAASLQELQRDNLDVQIDMSRYSVIDGFHDHPLFIDTWVENINKQIDNSLGKGYRAEDIQIVFSAHGMPVKNITRGDQYEVEIRNCIDLVMKELTSRIGAYDYTIGWQSKVGPSFIKWLEPNTIDVIKNFQKKVCLVVPIAFTSEHIETLHEIDIEFKEFVDENKKIESYIRAECPNDSETYINALSSIVVNHINSNFTDRKSVV